MAKSTVRARRRKALHPSTTPDTSNLTETGKMVEDIRTKIRDDGITLTIANRSKEKAGYHVDGGRHLPVRDFFGLTPDEEKFFFDEVERAFERRLK